ncbi:MAG: hypothetical protein LAQ69_33920 [Acidobacteriia bacterium]|nr:hypothetical protein [Terriglobia bacterium]
MRTWSLIFALALLPACRKAAVENRINPDVVSPGTKIHGKSYGEWSAEWWKFVQSIPSSDNPLLHDDKCEVGQSGPVWFLTGKWTESPIVATRHCTVPFGKYLFFPVVSAACDNIGNDPLKTVDELRALCRGLVDFHTGNCWLDGKELQRVDATSDSPYRVVSRVFSYIVPAGGVFGAPAGMLIDPVVSDGIFLMLEPLAAGRHTIRFSGSSLTTSYSYDITCLIDVVPPKK